MKELPIVSIVVPFRGYLFRILNIKLDKPKKGSCNQGSLQALRSFRGLGNPGSGFRGSGFGGLRVWSASPRVEGVEA